MDFSLVGLMRRRTYEEEPEALPQVGMLTSLHRDVSQKKFSGSRKKFLDEKFLDPKSALEQMWALKCLRMSLFFAGGWRLITPPALPHTSSVAVCHSVYLTPLI